jgi:WD40 repeat protein
MKTIALVAFVFVCTASNAQEPSPAKPIQVHSGTSDLVEVAPPTQAVEYVLFSKTTNGKIVPNVVVRPDRIDVMDEAGKVINTINREANPAENSETHIYPGRFGKVIGVHTTRGHSASRESWASGEYYILDASGRKTLEIKPFNAGTEPVPSPSGDYAVGWPEEMGPPIFYDASGIRNKWAHGFAGDGWPNLFTVSSVFFSPDGSRVAVTAHHARKNIMFVYDSQGNKIFEKDGVRTALFSDDSRRLAFATKNGTSGVMDDAGNILWEKPIVQNPAKFSADGKLLIFRAGPVLALFKADTGEQVWQWKPGEDDFAQLRQGRKIEADGPLKANPGLGILAVEATPDLSRIVAVGISQKYVPVVPDKPQRQLEGASDHVLIFDRSGNLISWKVLPADTIQSVSWMAVVPLAISDDGETVVVGGRDGLHTFSVVAKQK